MDADARSVTLNYTGGSLTTTIGVAKSLFGDQYDQLVSTAVPVNTSVSAHQRVRVIGLPASNVTAHSRDYQGWPTSQANGAAAGKKVLIAWTGSEGNWTGRVTGALADFGSFLTETTDKAVVFRSSRGTKYGPF
jgi:hypothetical protein